MLTGRQEEGRTRWRFRAGWKQYKRKAGKERRETGIDAKMEGREKKQVRKDNKVTGKVEANESDRK